MRLDLRFSERPVESLWCQAVVAFVPRRTFLTQEGVPAALDAKTGGFLARLEEQGFWTGAYGEDLLIASQGMIKADKILLAGLGPPDTCDPEIVTARAARVGSTLMKLRVQDMGVHVPVIEGREEDYAECLEGSVRAVMEPYLVERGEDPEFLLKAVFTVDRFFWGRVVPAADRLRAELEPKADLSVVVEREKREAVGY